MTLHEKLIELGGIGFEMFVIAVLSDLYREMKPHALGHATLKLKEND